MAILVGAAPDTGTNPFVETLHGTAKFSELEAVDTSRKADVKVGRARGKSRTITGPNEIFFISPRPRAP